MVIGASFKHMATLRLDRIGRLLLHCEITTPTAGAQKFHDIDIEKHAALAPSSHIKITKATAFSASRKAAKDFRPRRATLLSNYDEQALDKDQLGTNKKAHHLAFLATQKAVEHFDFAEFVSPI